MKPFPRSFSKLIGRPCWLVQRGYGTFLTMEFGEPHLEITEPREASSQSKLVRRIFARRRIHVQGDWHLWIYCCSWVVYDASGKIKGQSTSKASMDRAAAFLDGQKLVSAQLVRRGMRTLFKFDLGATLETRPYDRSSEQWMLYEPSGKVLCVRADKRYSYGSGKHPPERVEWIEIASDAETS